MFVLITHPISSNFLLIVAFIPFDWIVFLAISSRFANPLPENSLLTIQLERSYNFASLQQ